MATGDGDMILVVGLDAWPWQWRAKLEGDGFYVAPLHSPHAMSGPAWTSIMSGLRAETHKVRHNIDLVYTRRHSRERPLYVWDHLAGSGMDTVAVNVPFTWPPSLTRRLLVCGYPAQTDGANRTYPRSAAADFPLEALDLYYAYLGKTPDEFVATPDDELFAAARRARWALAHRFLVACLPDRPALAILCLTDIDRLGHYAFETLRDKDARAELLNDLMLVLWRIEAALRPAWTFVVSDHGVDLGRGGRGSGEIARLHGPDLPQSQTGVLAWRGPEAAALEKGVEPQLEDVVPTLLYLLDAVPRGPLDGTTLDGVRAAGGDDAAILEQLKGLGYA